MKEEFLHYIWQQRLFYPIAAQTTDGETVEVLNPGRRNTDAGPDFFNAKIVIGGTLWAGNVEIHSRASDWLQHGHHTDKAYDNVILHIVETADADVFRTNGTKIPQMVMKFPKEIAENYENLLQKTPQWVACEEKLALLAPATLQEWKNTLLRERLTKKIQAIEALLAANTNSWDDAFYVIVARNFGFGTNAQPFEELAKSLPQKILARHKDSRLQIEALLLGQAGLLPEASTDDYCAALKKEYAFLQKKYALSPLCPSLWKLLRLRPDNFPYVRIAQFAALVQKSTHLFSKIIEQHDITSLRSLFLCEVSDYWLTHYRFGNQSVTKTKKLSRQTIDILLINTVVPMLYACGEKRNNETLKADALALLTALPAEKNAATNRWALLGITARNAADSQALLQLANNYCSERKCLHCHIGHEIMAKKG